MGGALVIDFNELLGFRDFRHRSKTALRRRDSHEQAATSLQHFPVSDFA